MNIIANEQAKININLSIKYRHSLIRYKLDSYKHAELSLKCLSQTRVITHEKYVRSLISALIEGSNISRLIQFQLKALVTKI